MSERPASQSAAPTQRTVSLRRAALAFVLLLALGTRQYVLLDFATPLSEKIDRDGYHKLLGVAADSSPRAVLGWFIGDDPQRVHAFRPLPAVALAAQYRLWGWLRWPYLAANILLFTATALALVWLGLLLGMQPRVAFMAGALLMIVPSRSSLNVLQLIATQPDVFCTLFGILAVGCLIRWLDAGRRRSLAAMCGFALLACLSKEMGIALTPVIVVFALAHLRRRPPRRIVMACVGVLLMGAIWIVWYQLARGNMPTEAHPSHTFAGMWLLLTERWANCLMLYLQSLCRPLVQVFRCLYHADWWILLFHGLWLGVAKLALWLWAVWLLWCYRPRWLVVLVLWKVFTYLPVLPLCGAWGWYYHMPHILDHIFPVAVVWVFVVPFGGPRRMVGWWHAHSPFGDGGNTRTEAN